MKSRKSDFFKDTIMERKSFTVHLSKIITNIVLGSVVGKQLKEIQLFFKVELCRFFVIRVSKIFSNVELSNTVFSPLCQFTNTWCLHNLTCNDFQAFGVALVRRMTAATAAITLACLFIEMLCYVFGKASL